jgi:hypothetical protein
VVPVPVATICFYLINRPRTLSILFTTCAGRRDDKSGSNLASDGAVVMGSLSCVCNRFRDLISASKFFAWGFAQDPRMGALARCLSGRAEPCFETMVVSLDLHDGTYLRYADTLFGLLLTSGLSLTDLKLDGRTLRLDFATFDRCQWTRCHEDAMKVVVNSFNWPQLAKHNYHENSQVSSVGCNRDNSALHSAVRQF